MDVKDITSDTGESREPPGEAVFNKLSRRRSITIFVVVSILNAALLILLWTQLLTPAARQLGTDKKDPSTYGNINSPLVGKPAPDFKLKTLYGGSDTLRLSDFKGKPVILNFWQSDCAPCNDEASFLQRMWVTKLQSQGVAFIGIDGPETASSAQRFIQKYRITYANVQDTIDGSTAINYGVTGFPETIFINRDGIIVAKWITPLTEQGLQFEMAKMKL